MTTARCPGTTYAVATVWTGAGSPWRSTPTIPGTTASLAVPSAVGGRACRPASAGRARRGAGTWRTVRQVGPGRGCSCASSNGAVVKGTSVSETQRGLSVRMLTSVRMAGTGLLASRTVGRTPTASTLWAPSSVNATPGGTCSKGALAVLRISMSVRMGEVGLLAFRSVDPTQTVPTISDPSLAHARWDMRTLWTTLDVRI